MAGKGTKRKAAMHYPARNFQGSTSGDFFAPDVSARFSRTRRSASISRSSALMHSATVPWLVASVVQPHHLHLTHLDELQRSGRLAPADLLGFQPADQRILLRGRLQSGSQRNAHAVESQTQGAMTNGAEGNEAEGGEEAVGSCNGGPHGVSAMALASVVLGVRRRS
jgi:hypothetical protein